ncbi:MAG: HAD-IA family hydrolase [Lachnospiraceae bacterium]|nr:HAD-IA family hydrolase [Lachnospiraceae bacterium]
MRKTVLFDLDDTLYPELSFVKSGYHAVSELINDKYRLNGDFFDELFALFTEDPKRVFNRFLEKHSLGCSGEDIRELVTCYREHEPSICLYPDALNTLLKLKAMGYGLGIISDGYAISQKNKIKALFPHDEDIFDKIILTDELGEDYHKPDSRAFLMMKEFFGTKWEEMAYVGDNPKKDFYIGKAFPILTIRLFKQGTVYENSPYLNDLREKLRIFKLSELTEIVEGYL